LKYFYDLSIEEIKDWVEKNNIPNFRVMQIYSWKSKGISSFAEMSNISKDLRELLLADFYINGMVIDQKLISKNDGTIKYVFKLSDNNTIETVLMRYKHGNSICISSQSGCKMGCKFCASTGAGFSKNLSSGEMTAQVALVAKDIGERISNIVIMGIGEPFDNYKNVVLFIKEINSPDCLGIGMRHISISTCGLVDEMIKFTGEGLPVTLSVSLHAPNDTIRKQIMPVANKYSMDRLLDACRKHIKKSGRRITFEYALLKGVNDSPTHAKELAKKLKGILCHVNLIPANEFSGSIYRKSDPDAVKNFLQVLLENNINATVRRELGSDIMAACGQLRRETIR